jgi:hypothetical protein
MQNIVAGTFEAGTFVGVRIHVRSLSSGDEEPDPLSIRARRRRVGLISSGFNLRTSSKKVGD